MTASPFFAYGPAAVALRDESPGADCSSGRQQCAGDLGAEPVCQCELLIEFPEVANVRERGELVDDRIRLCAPNGCREPRLVQRIDDDCGHARVLELRGLGDRTCECYDFVFIVEQQRQQEFADYPSATGNENFHSANLAARVHRCDQQSSDSARPLGPRRRAIRRTVRRLPAYRYRMNARVAAPTRFCSQKIMMWPQGLAIESVSAPASRANSAIPSGVTMWSSHE